MLDQTAAEMTSAGNIEDGKLTEKQVMARVRVLGTAEGKGANSRPGLFLTVVEGAKHGAISSDPKKHQVAEIFGEYSRYVAAAKGVGWVKQDSETQQVAKLGVAARLGELPHVDGRVLMNRVVELQGEQLKADGALAYSPFDGFVKVARYQINKSPSTMLSDDAIRGLLRKDEKDDPLEADILERHSKALTSTIDAKKEDKQVSSESRDVLVKARQLIDDQIEVLGGSTAQRKAKAKEAAELQELISRGEAAKAKLGAYDTSEETPARIEAPHQITGE